MPRRSHPRASLSAPPPPSRPRPRAPAAGDYDTAQDLEFLAANKITRVVNCAGRELPNVWERSGVRYLTFYWPEAGSLVIFDDSNSVLDDLYAFVEEAHEAGESVLVHCTDGLSRAAFAASVYFMLKYRWCAPASGLQSGTAESLRTQLVAVTIAAGGLLLALQRSLRTGCRNSCRCRRCGREHTRRLAYTQAASCVHSSATTLTFSACSSPPPLPPPLSPPGR